MNKITFSTCRLVSRRALLYIYIYIMHHRPQPVKVPAANVPAADVPAADVPAAKVPAANVPAANVPAANVPAADVPAAKVPAANVPAANVPAANVPAAKVPAAGVPAANVPAADVPAAKVPAANVLAADVPAAKVPAAKVPAANVPAANVPAANVPAANVPAANVPAANAPAANAPAANVPAANVPAAKVPAANVPAANVPAANVPAAKVPAAGIPAATRLSPQHRKSLNKPAYRHLDRQTTRPWTRTNRDDRESEPNHQRGRRTKADETRGCGARRTGSWATKLTRNPRVSAEKIPRMHLGMAPPVKHGRISGRSALLSSVHMEHRFLGLDTGNRDVSRMNLDAAHPTKRIPRMDLGLVPPVRQERIFGRPVLRNSVHTEHRFPGLDAGDRAGSRMNLYTAQLMKRIPRMDLGLVPPVRQERISGRPVLRNSVHTEHRFPGLDAGDRAGSRMNLGTAQLMETEPRMHLGEPLRVNMIRARGGEVEVTDEEPEFGGSRAAPPQGADCGRPSRLANEGSANDGSDESRGGG